MIEKRIVNLFVNVLGLLLLFVSCDNQDDAIDTTVYKPCFANFSLFKENNQQLDSDIILNTYLKDTVELFIPHLKTDSLIASFEGVFSSVFVDGIEQISGESINDFSSPVTYSLIDENGKTNDVTLIIKGYNGIPRVEINTKDKREITSKNDYIDATINIYNCRQSGEWYNCKIKGRGNATWRDYPKKPYKIKLDSKHSILGFPTNKDWVLLAEYCDKSLLRTAYMCEVSKAVGMEYTVNYQHVELFLNDEYQGIYILTDQVEKGENRVQIEDDGFLIEDDNYYLSEPLSFTTSELGLNYTFKYPNADKGDIVANDDNYTFITNLMNQIENALKAIPDDNETYKKYIDINSFAKWYIVAEVTGNWEPNLYYTLPSKTSKLKMFPMWDAEWSLGLASKGNSDNPYGWYTHPYESRFDISIWSNNKLFSYLFKDPSFREEVKKEWIQFKNKYSEIIDKVSIIENENIYSQQSNFEKWQILGAYIAVELIAFDTWKEEADYVSTYFKKRFEWMDLFVNNL